MSHAQIYAAARTAQTTLAQHAGMSPTAGGNALLKTSRITVVFGPLQIQELPIPGGGYRRREVITATMTRDQIQDPPTIKDPFTRLDLPLGNVVYRIESVDTHSPIHYTLVLTKAGE